MSSKIEKSSRPLISYCAFAFNLLGFLEKHSFMRLLQADFLNLEILFTFQMDFLEEIASLS
jgi:hypothetical protein